MIYQFAFKAHFRHPKPDTEFNVVWILDGKNRRSGLI